MITLTGLVLGFFAGIGLGGARGAWEGLRENAQARRRPLPASIVQQPHQVEGAADGRAPDPIAPIHVFSDETATEPHPLRAVRQSLDELAPASDPRRDEKIAPLREPLAQSEPPLQSSSADPAHRPVESDPEIRQSIEEIRTNLREFREAMRAFEESRRPRRFF